MARTVRLVNTNPLGAVDLPLIGRTLAAGEEFEVTEEQAENLLSQVGNYERVTNTKSGRREAPSRDTRGAATEPLYGRPRQEQEAAGVPVVEVVDGDLGQDDLGLPLVEEPDGGLDVPGDVVGDVNLLAVGELLGQVVDEDAATPDTAQEG